MALSSLVFHQQKKNCSQSVKKVIALTSQIFFHLKNVFYLNPRQEVMCHSLHLSSTSTKKITFPQKRWCGLSLHLSSTSRKKIALNPLCFISLTSRALHWRKLAKLASILKTPKTKEKKGAVQQKFCVNSNVDFTPTNTDPQCMDKSFHRNNQYNSLLS